MTISSDAPGNLFGAGKPLTLTVRDAQGEVHYALTHYFGQRTAEGRVMARNGVATIALSGQRPGWYELRCQDNTSTATAAVGVVMDRGNAPLPRAGRVCGDAASAWLLHKEEHRKPFAQMLRLAGIPWVRERLSWGEVEREPGRFEWGKYQTTADTLKAEGVRVYQIWHDSPGWTRPNQPNTLCPDDLRTVYRFTQTAAQHFAQQIEAWEVWNEPDIFFWPDLSDRFAGLQKAAYLGLKDGNPNALVLHGSLCVGASHFARHLFASDIGHYFDVFNWHIYNVPSAYPPTLSGYNEILRRCHLGGRPAWLTEAGVRITGTEGEGKRLLNAADQRRQCRFVPSSVVMSLVAGNDKHFFFVLPDYLENGVQFGSLHPDLTPYPSFVALSAAANFLGLSEYVGEYQTEGISAHLFATPRGNVLVAWADKEAVLTAPTEQRAVHVADIFGDMRDVPAENGTVRVKVGPEAVYLVNVGKAIESKVVRVRHVPGKLPRNEPSRVVIVGYTDLPIDKERDCYTMDAPLKPFTYMVDVYNFDAKANASGTVEVDAPVGWRVEQSKREVKLEPMGREVLSFRVTPSGGGLGEVKITARGQFGGQSAPSSVSFFQFDPAALTPVQRKALDWANAAKWQPSASSNGAVTVNAVDANTLRIEARFQGEGDRWAYSMLSFDAPMDFSAFDGIAFDLKTDASDAESYVRMILTEASGAQYLTGTRISGDKRRVVFLFADMKWGGFSPPDPNHRLDLKQITTVKLGCNTPRDRMWFEAGHFELVKFADAK
ncbi:MAG: hypothetical protein NZT92_15915 [Abditibacteriales bacterium]|nr:hypothetical protein [Abditibacteriales bacterium]MDW8367305.1 hypothetical protein [Abditibacteriales bacterium]